MQSIKHISRKIVEFELLSPNENNQIGDGIPRLVFFNPSA
jgi:hypothetical protein